MAQGVGEHEENVEASGRENEWNYDQLYGIV